MNPMSHGSTGERSTSDELATLAHSAPKTYGRRIDCSEAADDRPEKAVRPPARSDGPRRDTASGGRRPSGRSPRA